MVLAPEVMQMVLVMVAQVEQTQAVEVVVKQLLLVLAEQAAQA